jgi:hypothetical protein
LPVDRIRGASGVVSLSHLRRRNSMLNRFSWAAVLFAWSLGAAGAATQSPAPAPLASVAAVQLPAWIDRAGVRLPLAPGTELRAHDQVTTGTGSRLLLRTADGSTVKLGENAILALDDMRMREDKVFAAAMKVAQGAFRFTTDVLAKFSGRRDVSIRFATVTAGIRGTDLWGKSTPDRQIVCLIEGEIEVTPEGEGAIRMEQPMSYYSRDYGMSRPVVPVPGEQLKIWAAETEPQPGRGLSTPDGKWRVSATGLASGPALSAYTELRNAGFPAEIVPGKIGERRVYDVRVANFATRQDAEFAAQALKRQGRLGQYQYSVGR